MAKRKNHDTGKRIKDRRRLRLMRKKQEKEAYFKRLKMLLAFGFLFSIIISNAYAIKVNLTELVDHETSEGSPSSCDPSNPIYLGALNITGQSGHGYWKFNNSLPSNIIINDAKLYLNLYSGWVDNNYMNLTISEVYNQTWGCITWNDEPCNNASQCNSTYESRYDGYGKWDTTLLWHVYYNWSVTNAVKNQYNQSNQNISFIMKNMADSTEWRFYSMEWGDTSQRPYLEVNAKYLTTLNLNINSTATNKTYSYGNTINVTAWNDLGLSVNLTRNGTPISNPYISSGESSGSYQFTAYLNNENYTANNVSLFLNMTKATTTLNLVINGTATNKTYSHGNTINVTAWNDLGLSVNLTRNGTPISNPYISSSEVTGYYQFTAYLSNQNYTANNVSLFLNVNKAIPNIYLALNGTEGNKDYDASSVINTTGWVTTGDATTYTLNSLNDFSTAKNLTFTGNQNITTWIILPKYAYVENAQLNLSGYSLNDTFIWNDTEAEASNVGGYLADPEKAYDENWGTESFILNYRDFVKTGYIYENYTTIGNASVGILTFKWGMIGVYLDSVNNLNNFTNLTMYCWNYTDNSYIEIFKNVTYMPLDVTISYTNITNITVPTECFNNKDRLILKTMMQNLCGNNCTGYGGNGVIATSDYETKVGWTSSAYPTNPYLDVANDGDTQWSYSGIFNKLNNRTSNLASEINSILPSCSCSGCSLNGTDCIIPLIFHSDTSGFLQISDINITYRTTYLILNGTIQPNNNTYLGKLNSGVYNFTFFYGETENYSSSSVTYLANVYIQSELNMTSCNETSPNRFITFIIQDEDTLLNTTGTLDITFEIWEQSTWKRNFSYSLDGNYTYSFCIEPNYTTYTIDAFMQYYNTTDYSTRSYYLYMPLTASSPSTIYLYMLPLSESYTTIFFIRDENDNPVSDYIIKTQRYYTGEGLYRTIAQCKSDSPDGKCVTFLRTLDVYYRHIVELDNVVVIQTTPTVIACKPFETITSCPPYPIVIPISTRVSATWFKTVGKIAHYCSVNNATNILSCTIADTSQLMSMSQFIVEQMGALTFTTLCNQTDISSGTTYVCDLGNKTNNIYRYQLLSYFSTPPSIVDSGLLDYTTAIIIWGSTGLILSFLIVGTLFFSGIANPVIAMGLGFVGIVIGVVLGMLPITMSSLIGLGLVLGIVVWKVRS